MTNDEMRNGTQPLQRQGRSRRTERAARQPDESAFSESQYCLQDEKQYQDNLNEKTENVSGETVTPDQSAFVSRTISFAGETKPEQWDFVQGTGQNFSRRRSRSGHSSSGTESYAGTPLKFVSQTQSDSESWTAYRRPTEQSEEESAKEDQFAYAPPVKLSIFGYDSDDVSGKTEEVLQEQTTEYGTANVYVTRAMSYSSLEDNPAENETKDAGYQIQEENSEPDEGTHKKHPLLVVCTALVALIAVAFLLFPDQITGCIGNLFGKKEEPAVMTVVSTPAPVKSFDASTPVQISSVTGNAILQISGNVSMEPHIVKETSILTRSERKDGKFDFYLFSGKEGRLLAYFEKLDLNDAKPMPGGGYYFKQSPYLINEDGSEMISSLALGQQMTDSWELRPLLNDWAVIVEKTTGKMNLVNREAQFLNRFWMSRLWPMTGIHTVGYVDTGNVSDMEGRYALYVLGKDGQAEKWFSDGGMQTVVASACDTAYLTSGELYLLDNLNTPLITTDEITIYVDCDAMVIRNPENGKYALYVQGKQHYDFLFDSIRPVESELEWKNIEYIGESGKLSLCFVAGADYPQPLTYYFLLSSEGSEEYVALSTVSSCPVVLE